jgi:hypothetical protein
VVGSGSGGTTAGGRAKSQMKSKLPLEQDLLRLRRLANRAAEMAIDSDFLEILAAYKERILREWANTNSPFIERREELYRDMQAVCRLEIYIKDELGQQLRAELAKQEALDKRENYGRRS